MNNYKKIAISEVYDGVRSYKQISLVKNFIFWVENISSGKNLRNAIFVRPFKKERVVGQNLIGDIFFIKSNFHGYGGKSYKCFLYKNEIYIIWIDQITKSLWGQTFVINIDNNNNNFLVSKNSPKQITKPYECNYDSCFVLINGVKLFGLCESDEKDFLFSVDINKSNQKLTIIKEFEGFASSLGSNEDCTFLSWLEWDTSNMTWEKNNLFFGRLNPFGQLQKVVKFNNRNINVDRSVSFFQPLWIARNVLVCSEDSSGWWNLLFLEIDQKDEINIIKMIKKEFYEYGLPEWVSGMSIFAGSQNNLFCLAKNKESWILEHYQDYSFHQKIDLPFNCLKDLYVFSNKLICIASSNISHEKLIEIEIDSNSKIFQISKNPQSNKRNSYSLADTYWFRGYDNRETHSWIYKPQYIEKEKPPLILKAHSGPTSSFDGSLNLEVQYWVSRGFFVAEVNYGGSTGFGRQYRERLNKLWGVVDSADCIALAQSLIEENLVDPSRIVISGNSAGGFTALNALCQSDIFKAAICKYPVIDLNEMYLNTHRFESNYLNSLIGTFACNKRKYFERSPKNKLPKINRPILLFHGKKDSVINYRESIGLHEKLLEKNVYSEIFLFDDEGHGFKNIQNKMMVLEKTDDFLKYRLNFRS